MAEDDGGGAANPYETQTATNTDPAWLKDGRPVDVDLDGLTEYAKHMQDAQIDLLGRMANLRHLHGMPNDAWTGLVLGEAAYTRDTMVSNAKELSRYLMELGRALQNIAMAAQTVADAYGSADGTSAASLNAVKFAFGDQTVPRPAGLPPSVGQTYWEKYQEDWAKGTTPLPVDSSAWSATTPLPGSPYQTTEVSTAANGQTREITTTNVPGGPTIVTTTVYGADRSVLSTSTEHRSTSTTTGPGGALTVQSRTQTSRNGAVTGSTETTTTYSGDRQTSEVTVTKDPSGGRTSETREIVGADGTTTTTTVNGKGEETDKVVVGPQTEGQLTPEKPLHVQHMPGLPD